MKKVAGTFVICAILFFCTPVSAKDFNRFGIGANIAYQDFEPGNFGDVDFNFKRTLLGNVTLTCYLLENYSIELSGGVNKSDMSVEYDEKNIDLDRAGSGVLGDLEQKSIALTGRFRFKINRTESFIHIGAGVGYYFNDFTTRNREELSDFFALNQSAESDDSIGFHLLGGTEIYITPQYAVCLELKCIFNQAEFEITYPDATVETKDVALNAAVYSLGIRYYF